jgi:hypothetical protein
MKYKQIGIDGSTNDYDSVEKLKNIKELRKALNLFFASNKEYNPRQLQYIVSQEANDISLDELIGIREQLENYG